MGKEELETELLWNKNNQPATKRKNILFYILVVLTVGCITSTIILSILYAHEKGLVYKKDDSDETPNSLYDGFYDFPLYAPDQWDVSANHNDPLTFTTSTGTWMSVDVSPDGKNIIFDMLGDIYLLDINGGNASPLRVGVPFETQPRFSPDGSKIVFTSDISGCDNIWIMDLNTKEEFQVTFESYFFVTNAFWIDNNNIVANKRVFVGERSIGPGEVWSYPIVPPSTKKNTGERLAERELQAGPEEPVPLTVNGKTFIYYSQNVADGSGYFHYNKDPHQLDTTTKETRTVASGAGGSARPIVSHNQKTLAYIKRAVFQTSLILHDFETGNEFILYNDLYLDQQESYAPAGVYPGFAFTPDDSRIVVWAQGNIYSIEVATGQATQIPFSVNVNMSLAPILRFSHPAEDGTTFTTKIITNPSVSGNKELFACTILASTYLYYPLSGDLVQLNSSLGDGEFQFSPSISNDNSLLVQVAWSDQSLSTIELYPISNLGTKYILPLPTGRYTQPTFSPSGNQILYIRLEGDIKSGSTYSANSGIYVIDVTYTPTNGATFGTPQLVTSSYVNTAVFSETGKSVLAQTGNFPMDVLEFSLNNPSNPTTLATGLYATEIAISPNKKFVAFIEFQQVYVAEYKNDKIMNVTTLSADIHPFKCSSTAGQYLTWSFDSSTVYWVWGPTMYQAQVSQKNKDITAEVKTYPISVVANTPVNEVSNQIIAFYNANILTMETEDEIISNATIVVKGDKIIAMGTNDSVVIPEGAIMVDVEGVTTVHNPSADTITVFEDAELVRAGRKVGPRIFSTGTPIYGNGGSTHCEIASVENATNFLLSLQAVGAWSAKSYQIPCRAAKQRLLEAARNLNMNIVPEGGMHFFWNLGMIIDGHTTLEHSMPMAPLYDDVINLFSVKNRTAYTPTLIVSFGGIFGERFWYQHTNVWDDQKVKEYIPDEVVQPITIRYVGAQDVDYHHFAISNSAAKIFNNGGLIETGAHGEMQGIGFHWEILMMNQSGLLSPYLSYKVLQTATINPAKALGLDLQIGSLKVGKLADLIFYSSSNNPLNLNTGDINWVMKNGHLYEAITMNQIFPTNKTRAPLPQMNLVNL